MELRLFGLACVFLMSGACVWAADIPAVKPRPGVTTSTVPSISVAGEAQEHVKPDVAILSLEAADEMPTAAAAAVENARLTQTIIPALKKYGLSDPDIQAGALDLSPQYRERTDPRSNEVIERIFTGYRASTIYRVRIHDLENAPRIAREIVESGSNLYRGMTFQLLNRDERLDALRAKALQNALQRAQRYAKNASLKLGDIIQIVPAIHPPDPIDRFADNARTPIGQVSMSVPSRVDDISLRAAVTVSWELKSEAADCNPGKGSK